MSASGSRIDKTEHERRPGFGLALLPGAAALSSREFVHRQLFDAILAQRLLPGARLREVTLATLFDVGRSAVREALQSLERIGLVEFRVNRGAQVATPATGEVAGLVDARRVVECALLERTVARLSSGALLESALEPLRALAREEGAHIAEGRRGVALRLGCEQHLALGRLADHPALADGLDRLVSRTALAVTTYERAGHDFSGWRSRLALFDVVARIDPEAAIRAMHAHLDALEASLDVREPSSDDALDRAFEHLSTARER